MSDAALAKVKGSVLPLEGKILGRLFGVGLVLWLFLSFGAIFIFDSPIQSRSDEIGRYTVAFFIWSSPITCGLTFLLYFILQRCGVR